MKVALVWFRNNLRLHDNEPLLRACEEYDFVLPFYCLPDSTKKLPLSGLKKTGDLRSDFLSESLVSLQKSLEDNGSGLYIPDQSPSQTIKSLLTKVDGIEAIYFSKEYAFEELHQENELKDLNLQLFSFDTNSLYTELPFAIDDLPDVFTNFRTLIERKGRPREELPAPKLKPSPQILGVNIKNTQELRFRGGESQGLKRLEYYLWESNLIKTYKTTRNELLGMDYSSKFSPWLANGCLSAVKIYWELKKYEEARGDNESTYWLFFELLWREFFRLSMRKHGKKVFWKSGLKGVSQNCVNNPELFERWRLGSTGEPFIDANMKELLMTGFMSNRGRQNVASYLIHDLGIDWRLGAEWFESQLIDYDVYSNWGNWAYLAGVGHDPRSRKFNISKQTKDYDPNGEFINFWTK
jgi:deoxyribodipyrimidine photo-lyase